MSVYKISSFVPVSQEVIEGSYWTLENLMESAQRARLRRLGQQQDEIIYGADLNPCILLGEN